MSKTASGQPPPKQRRLSSFKPMHKRKLFSAQTYDEVLAEDVSRADKKTRLAAINRKRKSEVALGEHTLTRIRPNLLGPTLTRRFAETSKTDFFLNAVSSSSGGHRPMEC